MTRSLFRSSSAPNGERIDCKHDTSLHYHNLKSIKTIHYLNILLPSDATSRIALNRRSHWCDAAGVTWTIHITKSQYIDDKWTFIQTTTHRLIFALSFDQTLLLRIVLQNAPCSCCPIIFPFSFKVGCSHASNHCTFFLCIFWNLTHNITRIIHETEWENWTDNCESCWCFNEYLISSECNELVYLDREK